MSWSRKEVSVLIEAYQKHACFYATKSPQYKNKHARLEALNNILNELVPVKPGVTINEIKSKFFSLKTTFLTEFRKEKQSHRSGAGGDTVYVPTLWYYEKMRFVLEHHAARKSVDSYGSYDITTQVESETHEIVDEEYIEEYTE
ncbi:hypothetical protein PPYR_00730 [Photinus pyralis]|uniref:MADF domain-containing protein n=1 Tax=Photinus pyralis TaxID=7054 RepID=A0A5N4B2Y3_PHOPY|nr:uncharacterized protein LOC116158893 [Photinus pyralis]KAB0803760.1 hypothetical protein PPYR_00730 [Photinus pyralis]